MKTQIDGDQVEVYFFYMVKSSDDVMYVVSSNHC